MTNEQFSMRSSIRKELQEIMTEIRTNHKFTLGYPNVKGNSDTLKEEDFALSIACGSDDEYGEKVMESVLASGKFKRFTSKYSAPCATIREKGRSSIRIIFPSHV